jgi:hypothetical protein
MSEKYSNPPTVNDMKAEAEKQKKGHVYLESEKARYTTHWDMDYLPLGKLKALYRRQKGKSAGKAPAKNAPSSSRLKRRVGWALIAAGIVTLLLVALIGR